jgi:hypothetical protein
MPDVEALLDTVLAAWPSEIDISGDGIPEPDAEGHHFLQLSVAWQAAEATFGADPDSNESYMVWAIYRELHAEAMRAARASLSRIRPRGIVSTRYFASYDRVQREKADF